MRIGVDLDNTIVCYDEVFRRAAAQRGAPAAIELAAVKDHLRTTLRAAGREDEWTELQGEVYGPGMAQARIFPGVGKFFARCREAGVEACIISHRSQFPYRGKPHDLHRTAREWLVANELSPHNGFPPLFLELTKEDKLDRIVKERCTHFIDDLPELLVEPSFPAGVARILFDPHARHTGYSELRRAGSWREIADLLLPSTE